jgi:predicted PhzF superfamily epimerase YddE/YHI9
MPAQLPFHLINAFAPRPQASGNQAAVVIVPASDARSTDDAWMRKTAADFQLSETAYLVPLDPEAEEPLYGLRWWTPEEVS